MARRASLAAGLLALAACTQAVAERAEPAPVAAPAPAVDVLLPRNDLAGLPNFARVSAELYRGAQPTAEGLQRLREMGVKTVVNLRDLHSDRDELAGLGLRYAHIHCKAWHPEEEDVVRFLSIVTDPGNQPVFVHCQHGADRTGMMVAAYRVAAQGWTAEEAAEELPRFGFHSIWKDILETVRSLDREKLRDRMAELPRRELETVR